MFSHKSQKKSFIQTAVFKVVQVRGENINLNFYSCFCSSQSHHYKSPDVISLDLSFDAWYISCSSQRKSKKKSAQTQDAGTTHRPVSVNADHFLGIFANWKDSHFYVLPCRGRRNSRHKRQVQDLQFHKRQKSDYFQAVRSGCEALISKHLQQRRVSSHIVCILNVTLCLLSCQG